MKTLVFLAGILAVVLFALGIRQNRQQEAEEKPEWEIIKSKKIDQSGDTIIVLQTMIKINNHE